MAVLDLIATARDDTFAARVAMILATLAVAATTEDPTTANHANRLGFAQKIIKGGVINNKAIAAIVIASNPTVQTEITGTPASLGSNVPDGDMTFVLTGLYDALANAYAT
jgi:hypothetical protein